VDYAAKFIKIQRATEELKPFLFKQSVAFFVSDDNSITIASGTLVSISDKVFIATASHAVTGLVGNEVYTFYSGENGSAVSEAPILKVGKIPGDYPDVGYLELGTNEALEYLKETACPLHRLAIYGTGRPLRPVMLVGNPGEYVKEKEDAEEEATGLVPTTIGYFTVPLLEPEWPDNTDLDPAIDIVLEYPDTPALQFESDESIMLPDPRGMSGGGLWDYGFEDKAQWTKKSAKLIGIQSCWYKHLRYAVVVQIIHWLKLIYSDYPDLRPIFEENFSGLSDN
jgi:hypothetical protein